MKGVASTSSKRFTNPSTIDRHGLNISSDIVRERVVRKDEEDEFPRE